MFLRPTRRAWHNRGPSPGRRGFLKNHVSDIWACDFFCVPTILFQTLHVFFVVRPANGETLHAEVTRHPTADWAAQQIVECCAWHRAPPRFLIRDRDSRYGASFDRRVRHLGIRQVRAPFRSPRANAVAERWVRSARSECLDHLFIFSASAIYVGLYPRTSPIIIGGARTARLDRELHAVRRCLCLCGKIVVKPVLGGCTTFIGLLSDISLFSPYNRPAVGRAAKGAACRDNEGFGHTTARSRAIKACRSAATATP
jgi:hypothetical protein